MLEILNTLSKSSEPLQHAVIFLFNGAEENILQVRICHNYKIYVQCVKQCITTDEGKSTWRYGLH